MRKNREHYPEEKFLEYYYRKGSAGAEFTAHLSSCPRCGQYYQELERFLGEIKTAFDEEKEIDWGAQRRRIMARLDEPQRADRLLKLVPIAAAVLIAAALFLSYNPFEKTITTDKYYVQLSSDDDLLLNEIDDMIDKPLGETMATINFWMNLPEQESRGGGASLPLRNINYGTR